jgi:hypothetical protein
MESFRVVYPVCNRDGETLPGCQEIFLVKTFWRINKELLNEVVFVCGATTELFTTNNSMVAGVRPVLVRRL